MTRHLIATWLLEQKSEPFSEIVAARPNRPITSFTLDASMMTIDPPFSKTHSWDVVEIPR
jgi:hypothetical protein